MKSFTQFVAEQYTIYEDKLQSDIQSLKRIGWNLDKVTKHLITKSDEYGTKITSDLVKSYYSPDKVKVHESVSLTHTALHDDDIEIEKYIKRTTSTEVSFDDSDMINKDGDVILKNALNGRNTVGTLIKAVRAFNESINEEKINGITAKKASISDRQKGESYTVYLKDTKKLIVSGITRASAIEITKSDDSKYAYASAEFFHDKIQVK